MSLTSFWGANSPDGDTRVPVGVAPL
jgi:hypothetical protein